MSLTLGMRGLLLVLTNQSTIIFIFFPRHVKPGVENSHAPGKGTKVVVALPLNQESILITLQLNQAASRGVGDGFGAADDIHLGEDCLHMRFHSALTNKKGGADLFVAFS